MLMAGYDMSYTSAGEFETEYNKIYQKIYANKENMATATEDRIYKLQLANLRKMYDATIDQETKLQRERLEREQAINDELLSRGFKTQEILALRKREQVEQELADAKRVQQEYDDQQSFLEKRIKDLSIARASMSDEDAKQAQTLIDSYNEQLTVLEAQIEQQKNLVKTKQEAKDLSDAELKAEQERLDALKKYGTEEEKRQAKLEEKRKKRLAKQKETADKAKAAKEGRESLDESAKEFEGVFGKKMSMAERKDQFFKATTNPDTGNFDAGRLINGLANLTQKLDNKIEEIAVLKGDFETQLQGTKVVTTSGGAQGAIGSIVDAITSLGGIFGSGNHTAIMNMAARSSIIPVIRQEELVKNIQALVDKGIAFDVTQRAFLNTIKDKIATTFDAANGTLLKLIRIQQADSTTARLGLESSLTAFLNSMYQTSEYMHEAAAQVKDSLYEVEALMDAKEAIGLEGSVQKWLGSLYSVGMQSGSVSNISTALGKILSGQIEGVTQGGAGNLIIMAANRANLSISDMLAKGLDESDTNKLLQAAVEYLQDIYSQSADNRVVAQQISNVFGVSASDLRAVANLMTDDKSVMQSIYNQVFDYQTSMDRVAYMANTMILRASLGEMMTNAWDNLQYTMASGIASNPVLYGIYKVGNLMKDTGANINLPFVNVMGFGVDLNTTVADLMIAGSLVGSVLSGIGNLIGGIAGAVSGGILGMGGVNTSNMNTLGLRSLQASSVSRRGGGSGSGTTVGESGYVGNSSGGDVESATMASAEDDKNSTMAEAKDNYEGVILDDVYDEVVLIYELLSDVTDGKEALWVQVKDYGLTGWTK